MLLVCLHYLNQVDQLGGATVHIKHPEGGFRGSGQVKGFVPPLVVT
jgi:hypothetical protein